jgi:hypothetical protein
MRSLPLSRKLVIGMVLLVALAVGARAITSGLDASARHEHTEALRAALGELLHRESFTALEQQHGFSALATRSAPQVSAPDVPTDDAWTRTESDRGEHEAPLDPASRGVVVAWSADEGLAIDPLSSELDEARVARTPDEVTWVIFTYRSVVNDVYLFGTASTAVERVDMRLVRVEDGVRLARATVEAVPPAQVPLPPPSQFVLPRDAARLAAVRLLAVTDAAPAVTASTAVAHCPETALAAETDDTGDAACLEGATPACMAACDGGDAGSCRQAALAIANRRFSDLGDLWYRGCEAGDRDLCTAWASRVAERGEGDDRACAVRVLERACDAHETHACGVAGHALATSSPPDLERARAVLDRGCNDAGGFACEVLARLLEGGTFGAADHEAATTARTRACATGWTASCGGGSALGLGPMLDYHTESGTFTPTPPGADE